MNLWAVAQQLNFAALQLIAFVMLGVIAVMLMFIATTAIASRPIARRALAAAANRAAVATRLERIATPHPAPMSSIPLFANLPDPRPAIAAHNAFLATRARRGNRRHLNAVA